MMTGISLNASMKSNLLALQQTSKIQSLTQERLSTGKKVNSAIDNPSSFYTASALNNRSSDLSALLDSMGQAIQNLQGVSATLATAGEFLTQASVVSTKALEALETARYDTKFTIDKDWLIGNGINPEDIVSSEAELITRLNTAGLNDKIIIWGTFEIDDKEITIPNGTSLWGADKVINDMGIGEFAQIDDADKGKIIFNNTTSANAIVLGNNSEIANLELELNSSTKNTGDALINADNKTNVVLRDVVVNYNDTSGNSNRASAISVKNGSLSTYGDVVVKISGSGNTGLDVENGSLNVGKKDTLTIDVGAAGGRAVNKGNLDFEGVINMVIRQNNSYGLYQSNTKSSGELNIKYLSGSGGGAIQNGSAVLSGKVNIDTKGYSSHGIFNSKVTFKSDLVMLVKLTQSNAHVINNMGRNMITWEAGAQIGLLKSVDGLDGFWRASSGGSSNKQADMDDFSQDPFCWQTQGAFPKDMFIDNLSDLNSREREGGTRILAAAAPAGNTVSKSGLVNGKISLENYEKNYNEILNQYDQLIRDSSYKGINVLLEQNLKIVFNEDRSSNLEIKGVDATLGGMGLEKARWNGTAALQKSIDGLTSAINKLRQFAEDFGTYNNIISNRETFTKSLIDVLTEGADKLTLADMNQESASILALQVRQQLATTSLSLASEASQSVLKLF